MVQPGQAIAVHSMALAEAFLTPARRLMVALTQELLDAGGSAAEALISRSARQRQRSGRRRVYHDHHGRRDAQQLDDVALADLEDLLAEVDPTEQSRLYWLAAPNVARRAATVEGSGGGRLFPEASPVGGQLLNIPMLVSSAVASGRLILVDASSLAGAADTIEVSVSRQAALQLDNAPTMSVGAGSPASPVAATAVSLFQTNSIAIRSIAFFGAAVVRSGGVAALDGMAWGEGSP